MYIIGPGNLLTIRERLTNYTCYANVYGPGFLLIDLLISSLQQYVITFFQLAKEVIKYRGEK